MLKRIDACSDSAVQLIGAGDFFADEVSVRWAERTLMADGERTLIEGEELLIFGRA